MLRPESTTNIYIYISRYLKSALFTQVKYGASQFLHVKLINLLCLHDNSQDTLTGQWPGKLQATKGCSVQPTFATLPPVGVRGS